MNILKLNDQEATIVSGGVSYYDVISDSRIVGGLAAISILTILLDDNRKGRGPLWRMGRASFLLACIGVGQVVGWGIYSLTKEKNSQ